MRPGYICGFAPSVRSKYCDPIDNDNSKKIPCLGTGPATQAVWLAKRGFKL